jgi:hypothetical protein
MYGGESAAEAVGASPSPSPSPPPASFSSTHSQALSRGVHFVSSYYKVLANQTDELYTFYDDDSVAVRIQEEEQGTIVDHEQHVGQLVRHAARCTSHRSVSPAVSQLLTAVYVLLVTVRRPSTTW